MEFAFLDESGDLGTDSKYLVLTLVCTSEVKKISKSVRRIKKRLLDKSKSSKWLNQKGGEIKFYGFPDENVLKRLLEDLSKITMHVHYICIDKGGSRINPSLKPSILRGLFLHSIEDCDNNFPQKIVADLNFFNKEKRNYFLLKKYEIKEAIIDDGEGKNKRGKYFDIAFSKIKEEEYNKIKGNKDSTLLVIEHVNSRHSEPLQAVDIISGAIFHKFEKSDDSYFKMLSKGNIKIYGSKIAQKK